MESLINYAAQHGLSPALIQEITSKGILINVKRNELLLDIGKRCNYIYFVIEGGFISQYFDENSSEYRTITFSLENYNPFMTQAESYFKNSLSNIQIKAFRNSVVIAFHRDDINVLCATFESFDKFCNTQIIDALITESEFKSKLISLPKNKLYKYFIEKHNPIPLNVPSKYIAEFMGVTPQWLSKIKRIG